jgi:hypothetical protein
MTERDAKPALYIDVDGVLFGIYDRYSQLRPNVVPFLKWCTEYFECYWLTSWPRRRLNKLFSSLSILLSCLMASDIAREIHEAKRTFGPYDKADAIDYTRPFFWIEDGISDDEKQYLAEHGALDRYIEVDPYGRDELERVWEILREKIEGQQ